MSPTYMNSISRASALLKRFLDSDWGTIGQVDELWSQYESGMLAAVGGAGHETEATAAMQAELDEVGSFASVFLTVAEARAAVYVLKMLKYQIDTIDLDAVIKIANLP